MSTIAADVMAARRYNKMPDFRVKIVRDTKPDSSARFTAYRIRSNRVKICATCRCHRATFIARGEIMNMRSTFRYLRQIGFF